MKQIVLLRINQLHTCKLLWGSVSMGQSNRVCLNVSSLPTDWFLLFTTIQGETAEPQKTK